MSIMPTEFNLDVDQVNITYFQKFLLDRDRELVQSFSDGTNLYRIRNRFVLLDEYNKRILYYIQWKDKFYRFIGKKAASGIKLWRGRVIFKSKTISPDVFFNRLLPIHGAIVCDLHHTSDGERFWLRRIGDAFEMNLLVYFCNFQQATGGQNRKLVLVESASMLEELHRDKKLWGNSKSFEARRAIISQSELGTGA